MASIIGKGGEVMVRIINCIGGYGDVLFCEPIFRRYWKLDGQKPIVIIHQHQMWIQEYIESAVFTKDLGIFTVNDFIHSEEFINLRYANQIFRGYGPHDHHDLENMMLDKYRLLGLPEDLWKTLDIKLTDKKGNIIMFANATIGSSMAPKTKWILINEMSQAGSIKINPRLPENSRIVRMSFESGQNLIDWAYRIYQVTENHHVSTSTFFLMQAIKNKYPEWNAPCYIYPRPNEDGLRGISQLHPDFNLIRVCQ